MAIPKPKIGDIFTRKTGENLETEIETALVVGLSERGKHWKAIVTTKNGADYFNSAQGVDGWQLVEKQQ